MNRIEEDLIKKTEIVGEKVKKIEKKIDCLIDGIFTESYTDAVYNFFDIKGTVLLHGVPGVGKTSVAYNVMNYALERYGVESYSIFPSEIIVSGLGETVKNLSKELKDFESFKEGILFIDEIDKFCINRTGQEELSELKRLLIEMMSFIDRLSVDKKKVLIGCTNVYSQIDDALKRRFTICEEIDKPTDDEKMDFIRICLKKINLPILENDKKLDKTFLARFETIDSIKSYFRDHLIMNSINSIKNDILAK